MREIVNLVLLPQLETRQKERLFGCFNQDGYVCKEQNPFKSVSGKCVCVFSVTESLEYGNNLLTFLPLYDNIIFSNNYLII